MSCGEELQLDLQGTAECGGSQGSRVVTNHSSTKEAASVTDDINSNPHPHPP